MDSQGDSQRALSTLQFQPDICLCPTLTSSPGLWTIIVHENCLMVILPIVRQSMDHFWFCYWSVKERNGKCVCVCL